MAGDRAVNRGITTCTDCMEGVGSGEVVAYEARGSSYRDNTDRFLDVGHIESVIFYVGNTPKGIINIQNESTSANRDGDVFTQILDGEVRKCQGPDLVDIDTGAEKRCGAIVAALRIFNVMNGQPVES